MCSIDYKIVVLGESTVGKSSLILRYSENKFDEDLLSSKITDNTCVSQIKDDLTVNLCIWDTVGQERYRALTKIYYRDVDAVVFVFDLNDIKTFNQLKFWVKDFSENNKDEVCKIVAGNKIDLVDQKQFNNQIFQDFAKNQNMTYIETSAKNNTNVKELFNFFNSQNLQTKQRRNTVKLNESIIVQEQQYNEPCCQI